MKLYLTFILCGQFLITNINYGQVNNLRSEYDPDPKNLCLKAGGQWALSYDVSQKNLEDIYAALNFSAYNIEIINCDKIKSSALAYLDNSNYQRYILINPNSLTDLNYHYYSHLFVIAHEFAHHKLNHFGNDVIPTQSNKRAMELEADKYAASIVKKLKGSYEDCIYALEDMVHPEDDRYSDHPTLSKRKNIVKEAFSNDETINIPTHKENYTDYFTQLKYSSLLKYNSYVTKEDIAYYYKKYDFHPSSVFYYNNHYWIYWEKNNSISTTKIYWDYLTFPGEEIQKYLDEGYNIKFLETINNKYFIVLVKYTTQFNQKTLTIGKSDFYNKTGSYLKDILENLKAGYSIQNLITYDAYNFMVLFSKYNNRYSYAISWYSSYDDYLSWKGKKENEDYNVMSCFKHIDGKYISSMQKSSTISDWSILLFDETNMNKVIALLQDNYYMDNITVDDKYVRFTLFKNK